MHIMGIKNLVQRVQPYFVESGGRGGYLFQIHKLIDKKNHTFFLKTEVKLKMD